MTTRTRVLAWSLAIVASFICGWFDVFGLGDTMGPRERIVREWMDRRDDVVTVRVRGVYTARGWDIEQIVFIGDASTGIGGCWLCHRAPTYWESSWTRDLTGFEPLDDAAREVLAFVALQIERDHHLGDRARAPWSIMPPPRDVHLRHLREFSEHRSSAAKAPSVQS